MCSYADSYKEVQQINERADSKLFLEIVTCKYLCQCVEVFGVIPENASEFLTSGSFAFHFIQGHNGFTLYFYPILAFWQPKSSVQKQYLMYIIVS